MSDNNKPRTVGETDYEVRQAFPIGGVEIILAENVKAPENQFYLVCSYIDHGIIAEYTEAVTTDDYLEAVRDFTGRINDEVRNIQAEIDAADHENGIFTAEKCFPHDYNMSILGEVVAVKPEALALEFRRAAFQLAFVDGGFGSAANPRGNGVYCHLLNNGKQTRFERYDVLGVVRPEFLPAWAAKNLEKIKAEKEASVNMTREVVAEKLAKKPKFKGDER